MPNAASFHLRHRDRLIIFAALLCFAISAAEAQTLHGRVVAVHAGDAFTLLDVTGERHVISLAAVAAPRRGQPFAVASREHLALWLDQRDVIVEMRAMNRDGTLHGTVFVDGHDVNLEQVRAGLCRRDPRAAFNQPADVHEVYVQAERAARSRRLGLWADPHAGPPSPQPDRLPQ